MYRICVRRACSLANRRNRMSAKGVVPESHFMRGVTYSNDNKGIVGDVVSVFSYNDAHHLTCVWSSNTQL